jgi:HEAT repeat protein
VLALLLAASAGAGEGRAPAERVRALAEAGYGWRVRTRLEARRELAALGAAAIPALLEALEGASSEGFAAARCYARALASLTGVDFQLGATPSEGASLRAWRWWESHRGGDRAAWLEERAARLAPRLAELGPAGEGWRRGAGDGILSIRAAGDVPLPAIEAALLDLQAAWAAPGEEPLAPPERVREAIVASLGHLGTPRATAALLALAGDAPSESVLLALGETGAPAARERLAQIVAGSPPPERAIAAALALGAYGDTAGAPRLLALVRAGGEHAPWAANVLGAIAGEESLDALDALLEGADDRRWRLAGGAIEEITGEAFGFSALAGSALEDAAERAAITAAWRAWRRARAGAAPK